MPGLPGFLLRRNCIILLDTLAEFCDSPLMRSTTNAPRPGPVDSRNDPAQGNSVRSPSGSVLGFPKRQAASGWVAGLLPRRLLLCALVALSGCAADPFGWNAKPDHPSLPAVFVTVARSEIPSVCYPHVTAWACAARDHRAGVCFVYVTDDAQPWLRTHELAHCAGWSHP